MRTQSFSRPELVPLPIRQQDSRSPWGYEAVLVPTIDVATILEIKQALDIVNAPIRKRELVNDQALTRTERHITQAVQLVEEMVRFGGSDREHEGTGELRFTQAAITRY